ncbi:MAG: hypothetical protein Ct9H90mP4_04770 [Gammaproteobacteria bacterium]|nr:MAG: hypothetical protein Ct9H90mP4_04770 [Gammaproteobacteria bacterium]
MKNKYLAKTFLFLERYSIPKINIENPIVASTKLDAGEIKPKTARQNDNV